MSEDGGGRRLLVVDDDDAFRTVMKRAMERLGFLVTVAQDVASALKVAESATLDCALLDVNMPGPSGLWLVPVLRRRHPDMRIVILSGCASPEAAAFALREGAAQFLSKPATTDEILAALR
jgi:two-component system response regulator RegA